MLQFQLNISKKLLEQIMIMKVAKIWANSGLKYSFSLKGVFSGKLTVITYVYLVSHMILQHFKNILKANHQTSGCMILVQNGSKFPVYPSKDFFAKWSIYCVPLCYNVSKKSLKQGRSWQIICSNLDPIWRQIAHLTLKENFLYFMYIKLNWITKYNVP